MRVLIVDDEPLARHRLARMCEERRDLDVVAQAGSGAAAIQAVQQHKPDVMLLDIELNDMTGFDVLRSFTEHDAPLAIIVTAYPERALEAFESNAVDYLTKPVDMQRFNAAIERARARHSNARVAPGRLVGERSRKIVFVDIDKIEYIESDLNYVSMHTADGSYLSRNTLKHLSSVLAPRGFVRIHKSLLVNLRAIVYAERIGHGLLAFTLTSGRRIESGAAYRKAILEHIRNRPYRAMSENSQ